MSKKEEVAKVDETSKDLMMPTDITEHRGFGTSGIGDQDVRPPRLLLAQAMSPQVKKTDPKWIEGLGEGDWFNDLTGDLYAVPLKFCVIAFLRSRFVEFDADGKVVDGDVPANDPRTEWGRDDETGKGIKPRASKFYDYLIWLVDQQEVVTWSIKNKIAATIGIRINSLIKSPAKINGKLEIMPPACARLFQLGTATDRNEKGQSWAVPTLRAMGITEEADRIICYALGKQFAGKNIIVAEDVSDSAEPADGGDGSFATDM